jgi:hypothetical protein
MWAMKVILMENFIEILTYLHAVLRANESTIIAPHMY